MLNTERLLSWVIILESSLVFIGNVVTVLVFWKQRVLLKRACYLLLNLAFADSLVGATELIHAAIHERAFSGSPLGILGALFASVSLLSLVLIALERAYAVLWPLSSQSSKRSKLHHQYSYGLDRSRVLDNDAFNITASCWQRRQIAFIFTRKHSDSNVPLPDNGCIPGNKETDKKHKSYIRSPLPKKLQTER